MKEDNHCFLTVRLQIELLEKLDRTAYQANISEKQAHQFNLGISGRPYPACVTAAEDIADTEADACIKTRPERRQNAGENCPRFKLQA